LRAASPLRNKKRKRKWIYMIDSSSTAEQIAKEANRIIEQAKKCTERGEGRGKQHVFLGSGDVCECGKMDLQKVRMR
jgi:hypothetical protein